MGHKRNQHHQHERTPYQQKLLDPRWQKKRLEILSRDEWACQKCFDSESTLHVHHRYYEKDKDPWEYDAQALVTLCANCHEEETNQRPKEEYLLLAVMRRLGFYADDIHRLTRGLSYLHFNPQYDWSLVVLEWIMKHPEMLDFLTEEYQTWSREQKTWSEAEDRETRSQILYKTYNIDE
jgi:hypothetical protein